MRVYTAGPMSNIAQFNYPAFIAAAAALRDAGYEVVSPAELDNPDDRAAALASPDGHMLNYTSGTGKSWGDFLSRDVKLLADDGIEAIVVLPGWEKSRGARLETFVGSRMCGMPIYLYEPKWLPHMDRVPDTALIEAWAGDLELYFVGGVTQLGGFGR